MSAQTPREDSFVCILYYLEGTDKAFKLITIDTCSVSMMLLQYAFFAFAAKISIFENSKKTDEFLNTLLLIFWKFGEFLNWTVCHIYSVENSHIMTHGANQGNSGAECKKQLTF